MVKLQFISFKIPIGPVPNEVGLTNSTVVSASGEAVLFCSSSSSVTDTSSTSTSPSTSASSSNISSSAYATNLLPVN